MTVICKVTDCVNKGKECCMAGKIELDAEGCCTCYQSIDELMRQKPRENWTK